MHSRCPINYIHDTETLDVFLGCLSSNAIMFLALSVFKNGCVSPILLRKMKIIGIKELSNLMGVTSCTFFVGKTYSLASFFSLSCDINGACEEGLLSVM